MYTAMPGINLLEAVDRTNKAFGIEVPEQVPAEAHNDQSLAELESFMRGVK
jgi:hypothetical protein